MQSFFVGEFCSSCPRLLRPLLSVPHMQCKQLYDVLRCLYTHCRPSRCIMCIYTAAVVCLFVVYNSWRVNAINTISSLAPMNIYYWVGCSRLLWHLVPRQMASLGDLLVDAARSGNVVARSGRAAAGGRRRCTCQPANRRGRFSNHARDHRLVLGEGAYL